LIIEKRKIMEIRRIKKIINEGKFKDNWYSLEN